MTTQAVSYTSAGDHVAVITMNRAERMNRLDADIVAGLEAAWQQFMDTDDDRVAVLAGDGKAFSAGADLKAIPHDLFRGIPSVGVAVDKPVVAAVQGWCVGGGMVLTTMCDILVATEDAMFSYPEVKIGFSGGLISTLACRIPHKIAMDLLLTGDAITAQRAYEVGYVNKLVSTDELMDTAMDYAKRIAAQAPLPSRMLKRFVGEAMPKGPSEVAGIARAQVNAINASSDGNEGIAAFMEKRPPVFKGE
ncbi:MAG: enoyl-CoA hydratase [Rhodospirillaceae bacterium]|jgi:enoyl-CoA hydratase|nr:enoyl-CoA hydratase [Rhodospirillaceae bacterium]